MKYFKQTSVLSFQNVVTLGHETINTPLYCQLDGRQCHVATDRLCRYVLVGESEEGGGWAIKSLTLAAFAPSLYSAVDYNIRVYCVEDTRAALQVKYTVFYITPHIAKFYQFNEASFFRSLKFTHSTGD